MRNGVQYGVDTADVLSTVAECDASASGGKGTTQVASAKALSELNSNFSIVDGNYQMEGKTIIANALTNRGIETNTNETFTEMANKITTLQLIKNCRIDFLGWKGGTTITTKDYIMIIFMCHSGKTDFVQSWLSNCKCTGGELVYNQIDVNDSADSAYIGLKAWTDIPAGSSATRGYACLSYGIYKL